MRKTIEKIIGSVPENLTELETAYFVYLELGKVLAQDTEYSLTRSLSKQSRLFEAGKNINNINFPNVICNSSSELYTYILNKLGIKAKVFYFKGLEHADTIIKTKDGNIYYANLLADLAKIQTGSRTRNFAPPSEHLNGVVYYELARKYSSSLKSLPTEELELGYRTSIIKTAGYIVLEAKIRLKEGDPEVIRETMKDLTIRRTTKQPLEYPSAGSTFKRPEGYFAGKLIMDSGLAGYQVGGAQVSEKHCGFVINAGDATARDVRTLMDNVRDIVYKKYGVTLEPEVKFLGEF